MSLIGNILWIILGGLWSFLGYAIGGFFLCLTIVGIPFGVQAYKIGVATLTPFGRKLITREEADSPLRLVFNVIWIVFFGWEIALAHLSMALMCAITIIGIPFAVQHLKLAPLSLVPFGRDLK